MARHRGVVTFRVPGSENCHAAALVEIDVRDGKFTIAELGRALAESPDAEGIDLPGGQACLVTVVPLRQDRPGLEVVEKEKPTAATQMPTGPREAG